MAERLFLENVRIFWTNFRGEERGKFNPKGKRNFCVEIPQELVPKLQDEGWNVKTREFDDGSFRSHISVELRFDNFPPIIHLVTSRKMTELNEELVGQLDTADISNVDMIINPSTYSDRDTGKTRIKAYLKEMWVTIQDNPFMAKYANYD
jgi:hypothetical protein